MSAVARAIMELSESRLARENPEVVARACAGREADGIREYACDPLVALTVTGKWIVARWVCNLLGILAGNLDPYSFVSPRDPRRREVLLLIAKARRHLAAGDPASAARAVAEIAWPGRDGDPPEWLVSLLEAYARAGGVRAVKRSRRPVKTEAIRYINESGLHPAYAALLVYGSATYKDYMRLYTLARVMRLKIAWEPFTPFPSVWRAVARAARLGMKPDEIAEALGVPLDRVARILRDGPVEAGAPARIGAKAAFAGLRRYIAESGLHPAYAYIYAVKAGLVYPAMVREAVKRQRKCRVRLHGYRDAALFPRLQSRVEGASRGAEEEYTREAVRAG